MNDNGGMLPNYLPGCVILDAEEQGDITDRLNILSRVTIVSQVTKVFNLKVKLSDF